MHACIHTCIQTHMWQIENAGAIERCKKLEDSIARDDWQAKARVGICIYIYTHIYTHLCMRIRDCKGRLAGKSKGMYMYIYIYTHIYTHTCACVYEIARDDWLATIMVCTYIHMYIHKFAQAMQQQRHTYVHPHIHTWFHYLTLCESQGHTYVYTYM